MESALRAYRRRHRLRTYATATPVYRGLLREEAYYENLPLPDRVFGRGQPLIDASCTGQAFSKLQKGLREDGLVVSDSSSSLAHHARDEAILYLQHKGTLQFELAGPEELGRIPRSTLTKLNSICCSVKPALLIEGPHALDIDALLCQLHLAGQEDGNVYGLVILTKWSHLGEGEVHTYTIDSLSSEPGVQSTYDMYFYRECVELKDNIPEERWKAFIPRRDASDVTLQSTLTSHMSRSALSDLDSQDQQAVPDALDQREPPSLAEATADLLGPLNAIPSARENYVESNDTMAGAQEARAGHDSHGSELASHDSLFAIETTPEQVEAQRSHFELPLQRGQDISWQPPTSSSDDVSAAVAPLQFIHHNDAALSDRGAVPFELSAPTYHGTSAPPVSVKSSTSTTTPIVEYPVPHSALSRNVQYASAPEYGFSGYGRMNSASTPSVPPTVPMMFPMASMAPPSTQAAPPPHPSSWAAPRNGYALPATQPHPFSPVVPAPAALATTPSGVRAPRAYRRVNALPPPLTTEQQQILALEPKEIVGETFLRLARGMRNEHMKHHIDMLRAAQGKKPTTLGNYTHRITNAIRKQAKDQNRDEDEVRHEFNEERRANGISVHVATAQKVAKAVGATVVAAVPTTISRNQSQSIGQSNNFTMPSQVAPAAGSLGTGTTTTTSPSFGTYGGLSNFNPADLPATIPLKRKWPVEAISDSIANEVEPSTNSGDGTGNDSGGSSKRRAMGAGGRENDARDVGEEMR